MLKKIWYFALKGVFHFDITMDPIYIFLIDDFLMIKLLFSLQQVYLHTFQSTILKSATSRGGYTYEGRGEGEEETDRQGQIALKGILPRLTRYFAFWYNYVNQRIFHLLSFYSTILKSDIHLLLKLFPFWYKYRNKSAFLIYHVLFPRVLLYSPTHCTYKYANQLLEKEILFFIFYIFLSTSEQSIKNNFFKVNLLLKKLKIKSQFIINNLPISRRGREIKPVGITNCLDYICLYRAYMKDHSEKDKSHSHHSENRWANLHWLLCLCRQSNQWSSKLIFLRNLLEEIVPQYRSNTEWYFYIHKILLETIILVKKLIFLVMSRIRFVFLENIEKFDLITYDILSQTMKWLIFLSTDSFIWDFILNHWLRSPCRADDLLSLFLPLFSLVCVV